MMKADGKIIGVDLIKKSLIVEVDRSQTKTMGSISYYPLIYGDATKPQVVFLELTKSDDKFTFFITFTKSEEDLWNCIRSSVGKNIQIQPNKSFTAAIKSLKAAELQKFILL